MDHLVGSHHLLPGFMLHHNSHSMVNDTDFVSIECYLSLMFSVQVLKSHVFVMASTLFSLNSHRGTVFSLLDEKDVHLIGQYFLDFITVAILLPLPSGLLLLNNPFDHSVLQEVKELVTEKGQPEVGEVVEIQVVAVVIHQLLLLPA
jgi:hypothetical protein